MACNGVVVRLHRLWYFTSALVFLTSALKNWRCLAVSSLRFAVNCGCLAVGSLRFAVNCGCLAVGSLCLVVSFVFAVTRYMGHRKRKNLTAKRKRLTAEEKTCQPLYALFYAVRTLIFRLP